MGKSKNSVFQDFKECKSTGQVQLPQQKKPKRKTIKKMLTSTRKHILGEIS
jgi:hypothetical protein